MRARVVAQLFYKMEYLTSHLNFLDKRVTSYVYHESELCDSFISCHRKYSGQHNHCDIRAPHYGKVGCKIVE